MSTVFTPDSDAAVLVVGDVILDRYVHGETTRISPEAPVPVVLVKQTDEKPGGAGNVALNIAKLGIKVNLVGLTGNDPAAGTLKSQLGSQGVHCRFLGLDGFPTITKLRVLSQHQQLVRLDFESTVEFPVSGDLLNYFMTELEHSGLVVLSDYAKGSLDNIQQYISASKSKNKMVLIDPKGSDFSRYSGADVLTPNLKEFVQVVGNVSDTAGIVEKGHNLCRELKLNALLVTRGEQGMTLVVNEDASLHLDAEAREVFDVTGAGDTVIATMASALASGYSFTEAAAFANRAAGMVVAKLGAASVTVEELNHVNRTDINKVSSTLKMQDISGLISEIRARGESIVMTNGCFDILHAGHVSYLAKAKQLGDYLIVAVNDDASVSRLKGPGRPVNNLDNRVAVLGALKSVDWVVPFADDTPENLIKIIEPDVLVKGGDYQPDQIAGAEYVTQNGGQVTIIPLLNGHSTTKILQKIKE